MEEKTYHYNRLDPFSIVFLFLLIAVLIITGGYVITFAQTVPSAANPTIIIKHQNLTKDWQTYTSDNLKISFNYPPNWKLDEKAACCSFAVLDKAESANPPLGYLVFKISREANPNDPSIDKWLETTKSFTGGKITFDETSNINIPLAKEVKTGQFVPNDTKKSPQTIALIKATETVYVVEQSVDITSESKNINLFFQSLKFNP